MLNFEKFLIAQQLSINTIEQYMAYETKFINSGYDGINQDTIDSFLASQKYTSISKGFMKQYISWLEEVTPKENWTTLKIRKRKGRVQQKETEYITIEQVHKLINQIYNKGDLKYSLIVALLFEGGLRISELLNLKWNDVKIEECKIKVRNAKGGKYRDIMFSSFTKNLIKEYCDSPHFIPDLRVFNFEARNDNPSNFEYQSSKRSSLCRVLKGYGNEYLNIDYLHPHVLRHSCGYYLANVLSMPLDEVAIYLGHSKIDTTRIYAHKDKDIVLHKVSESFSK